MRQGWRVWSFIGATGLVLVGALGPSQPILADGKDGKETKPTAAKPVNLAKPNASTRTDKAAANTRTTAASGKVSPQREVAAIAFASENHPELATLLGNLKQNNPTEYQAAVAELDRVVERLAAIKPRNLQQHDSELAHWKIDSRIRLLAARLTMSDNPAIEAELKAAVREKVELTLAERKTERERLLKRIDKLDQSIGDLSTKLDEAVDKELALVKRGIQSSQSTVKHKPAKKGEEHAAAKPGERSANEKNKPNDAGKGDQGKKPGKDSGKQTPGNQ